MGIFFDQHSVVERPRLALVAVDAQVDWTLDILGEKRPLESRRKPCTTASS